MAERPFQLTLSQAVRIAAEFAFLSGLVGFVVAKLSGLLQRFAESPSGPGTWEFCAGSMLGTAWAIARALRRHGLVWSDIAVWRVRPAGLVAPFCLLVVAAGMLLTGFDNLVEAVAPTATWIREIFEGLTDPESQPLAGFVALTVVAPLTEEIICRGLILRGLLARHSPLRAVLWSAAIFAIMHLNPWQLVSAFVAGLILGWAYVRTRSLGLCFLGHALHNALWFFAAFLPFELAGVNSKPAPGEAHFVPWWFVAIGAVLFAVGAVWFGRSAPSAQTIPFVRPDDLLSSSESRTTAGAGAATVEPRVER
ncbi:MAG TPA: CPBP family intramembrane glutamic endopeptidase [Terriglobales bacterium]|nr:CPBP family intramembrane glutamic endopeptidase [Terriglobales bacterium]